MKGQEHAVWVVALHLCLAACVGLGCKLLPLLLLLLLGLNVSSSSSSSSSSSVADTPECRPTAREARLATAAAAAASEQHLLSKSVEQQQQCASDVCFCEDSCTAILS
jgi:hypothetical protein